MPQSTHSLRIKTLENKMDALAELPYRMSGVETRLSGVETRLSGVETRLSGVETRLSGVETRLSGVETRLSGVETRLSGVETDLGTVRDELRSEIRSGDEETRRQMRVLHEDVIARIALLQEGFTKSMRRPRDN